MGPLDNIMRRAAMRPATVVLSEGEDPRIVTAAFQAAEAGIAKIVLVGDTDKIAAQMAELGLADHKGVFCHDPNASPLHDEFATAFHELRKHKGVTPEKAADIVRDPLVYAAMMVRLGHADGTVGGAVATTPDVVRAALQVIGKAKDAAIVSSFFLMVLREPENVPVIFSDSGLVVDPSAEELAEIAKASAQSFRALVGEAPKVAMLSFSTMGSAAHADVRKVQEATAIAKAANPDLALDGELQFDAAFVPEVGKSKAPGSSVAGQANVFIFPNLNAGNIGYKIAQRIGGATAIGPILQGLAKPANDLSRGCTSQDVVHMIAVTVAQAQAQAQSKTLA